MKSIGEMGRPVVMGTLIALSASLVSGTAVADENAAGARHDCLIAPSARVDLGAEVQGVIDRIEVEPGDRVKAGQALAYLKATVEQVNVAQARDRVAMDSEISARQADVDYTGQVLDRQQSLSAQDLSTQQAIDEARARHLVARAALRRARDDAIVDQHELLRHEALLAQRTVVTPIDGVVVRRHAEPGELIIDTPVLTVAALATLRVDVVLPASAYGDFHAGDLARIYPETDPHHTLDARVTIVDPMLDAASGTFALRLTLDNADHTVLAGQECQIEFDTDRLAESD